jgi:hypothetical protein
MEWRLYPGQEMPPVSTREFHEGRDRAAHLEQEGHRERLMYAAHLVATAAAQIEGGSVTVSDLGCGDGGLLSVVGQSEHVTDSWGYDFCPANQQGWAERGIKATALDVFNGNRSQVALGDVTVMTEVLEHLADPHGVLRWVGMHSSYVVVSSPAMENDIYHDACHAWAWDVPGFRQLVEGAHFEVLVHELCVEDTTQIILARNRWGRI